MQSLKSGRVADALEQIHARAEIADEPLILEFMTAGGQEQAIRRTLEQEAADLPALYRAWAGNYLNVSRNLGQFLYGCARARRARTIVEFGTSFGISAIYLACALRDMGGGRLICTELEPSKAAHAQANLELAGLADLVEIRVGDARETLASGLAAPVDMAFLDGAFTLYLPVLKLIEPYLEPGAVIVGENAFEEPGGYLRYVRDPANGYLSQPLPVDEGRGNEFTVKV